MTDQEKQQVLERAGEAGTFDDLLQLWFDAPSSSREEADAYRAIRYRACDLIGDRHRLGIFVGAIQPSATGLRARYGGLRVGDMYWSDHIRTGMYSERIDPDYVPDDLLDVLRERVQNRTLSEEETE